MPQNREEGLTLIELLITITLMAVVSALVLPIITANITLVSQESTNRSLTEIANFIRDWDRAEGTITVVDGRLQANYNGMDVENIALPEGFALLGSGTLSDPYRFASLTGDQAALIAPTDPTPSPTQTSTTDPTPTPTPTPTTGTTTTTSDPVVVADGTLTQPSTVAATTGTIGDGLTFSRDANKLILQAPRANWAQIQVTYTQASTQTVTLQKRQSNGTTVGGTLLKVSNAEIHILLPSTQPFTLAVNYNGGSTGYFFFL